MQILKQKPNTAVFKIHCNFQKLIANFSVTFLFLCTFQVTCKESRSLSKTADFKISHTCQKTEKNFLKFFQKNASLYDITKLGFRLFSIMSIKMCLNFSK